MAGGVQPLSLGEYDATGGSTGFRNAANAFGSLGSIIAQGPMQAARGAYMGAETGHMQAQTRALNDRQQDLQTWQQVMQDPAWISDPKRVAFVGSLMAKYPEDAVNFGKIVSSQAQAQAFAGNGNQGSADRLAAGTGTAAMGNTSTGQQLGLANNVQVANIGAGPGYAAANASLQGHRMALKGVEEQIAEQHDQFGRTLVPTGNAADPNAVPTYTTRAQAPGMPAYEPSLANTIAGARAAPVQVVDQANPSGTKLSTVGDAITQGLTPRMQSVPQAQAAVVQDAFTPPAPPQPTAPGTVAQTISAGANAPPAPGPTDTLRQIRDAQIAQISGRPPPGATSPADTAAIRGQIVERLQAMKPVSIGSNEPAPQLLDPIILQATWLHDYGPMRGDWGSAITQAIQNVTGGAQGLDINSKYLSAGPSQIVQAQGGNIQWPQGMPVPPQYRTTQPQPGTPPPAAPGSASAAPPAPPARPGQPAALPPGVTPAQAIAQAKAAIAAGKDPNAVMQRLQTWGINPAALGQ